MKKVWILFLSSLLLAAMMISCAAFTTGEKKDEKTPEKRTETQKTEQESDETSVKAATDSQETNDTSETPTASQRSVEELRELVPDYFMEKSFKGIELYARTDGKGDILCAVMPGTNRLKAAEEINALVWITPEEMKSIFDAAGTDMSEVFLMPGVGERESEQLCALFGIEC